MPPWLAAPTTWAFVTGVTYIAAGVAIITGVYVRLAAVLSAVQIGFFTLLAWVPVVVGGQVDAGKWNEFVVSWVLTAAAWVVADSYYRGSIASPASSLGHKGSAGI